MYETVISLLARQLEIDPAVISRDTNILADLGADSLDVAELLADVEDRYALLIDEDVIADLITVGDVADYLDSLM